MSDVSKLREVVEEKYERLEETRAEINFDECSAIKQAGEQYRDSESVESVADDLNLDEDEAEQLIAKYITIVNNPTMEVRDFDIIRGIQFFGDQESLDEIADSPISSEERIKEGLRDYTGMILEEEDFQEANISVDEIPEEPVYPPQLRDQADRWNQTLQEVSNAHLQAFGSMTERLTNTLQENIQPVLDSLADVAETYRSRLAEAISDGISNFESPEDYDSDDVEVDPVASLAAEQSLERFIEAIEEEDEESLNAYIPRLEAILQDYREGRYYTPIYAAISVQDGLMHWICEQSDKDPKETNRFGEPHYKWDTKRNILASRYDGWYDVETGEVCRNLESFYRHRNAIMHGDPLAYFDKNIATISILLLNLTLYTVVETVEAE